MFLRCVEGVMTKEGSKAKTSKNKEINEMKDAVAEMKAIGGYVPHAKMDHLKGLLLDHFSERAEGDGRGDVEPGETRVMVFCMFRECVEEIVVRLLPLSNFVSPPELRKLELITLL
jgi:ERCC4-related helicase